MPLHTVQTAHPVLISAQAPLELLNKWSLQLNTTDELDDFETNDTADADDPDYSPEDISSGGSTQHTEEDIQLKSSSEHTEEDRELQSSKSQKMVSQIEQTESHYLYVHKWCL